jgi:Xaa-Pro aminopeptidase
VREYPKFSQGEYSKRYAAVRQMMSDKGLDLLVVHGTSANSLHGQANIHYVSNLLARHDAYVVFPIDGEPSLFVEVYNHLPNARDMSVIRDTQWAGVDSACTLRQKIGEKGYDKSRIGLVGKIPYQIHEHLTRELPNSAFSDVTPAFNELRLVKSEEELDWIRRAATFTDKAMEALENQIQPGMREEEIARIVSDAYLGQGGQTHFYYAASTAMKQADVCVPAQHLSNRKIGRGDVIITEISASYWGYSGQIHRPITVEEAPTGDYQKLYNTAFNAYESISNVIKPGAGEADVLDAAEVIDESGFTMYDTLVHGFGVDVQPPDIRTKRTPHGPTAGFIFKKNMTVVIQPNIITKNEKMGIQLGNLTHVTESGAVSMQKYPIKFVRCG